MAYDEKLLIFIVDDNTVFSKTFAKSISTKFRSAIEVKLFRSGEACLKALDLNPSLIFLDYYLDNGKGKKLNGYEVLGKIRSDKPYLPVIMVSVESKFGFASEAIEKGAMNYIVKDGDAFRKAGKMITDLIRASSN